MYSDADIYCTVICNSINLLMTTMLQKIVFFTIIALSVSFTLYTAGNSWSLDSGIVGYDGYSFTRLPARFNTYFSSSNPQNISLGIVLSTTVAVKVAVMFGLSSRTIIVEPSA
jgi:hypothetical protein